MKLLGIDPGTACGWAVVIDGHHVTSGVWDLRPRRHEGGGMRYLRVSRYLCDVLDSFGPAAGPFTAVGYEEVRRHAGVDAAHVYGGIVAVVQRELEQRSIPYSGVHWATVKRLATGKGNADKPAMVEAFARRVGRAPEDDNEADAYFVALALAAELA